MLLVTLAAISAALFLILFLSARTKAAGKKNHKVARQVFLLDVISILGRDADARKLAQELASKTNLSYEQLRLLGKSRPQDGMIKETKLLLKSFKNKQF